VYGIDLSFDDDLDDISIGGVPYKTCTPLPVRDLPREVPETNALYQPMDGGAQPDSVGVGRSLVSHQNGVASRACPDRQRRGGGATLDARTAPASSE